EAQELTLLPRLQFRGIVGLIKAQALDGVRDWPFLELGPERAAEFELERPRTRLLDRPTDPEVMINGAEQRLASIFAVEQHAVARSARSHFGGSVDRKQFEGADPLARSADVVGD